MTGCERVLELLSDGRPHSHHEGYALHVILHSRVSDLRKRGHHIDQWREGDLYLYQLVSSTDVPSIPGGADPGSQHDHAAHHGVGGGRTSADHIDSKSPLGSGDAGPSPHPDGSASFAMPAHALVAAESAAPVGEDGVNDLERASSPTQLDLFAAVA